MSSTETRDTEREARRGKARGEIQDLDAAGISEKDTGFSEGILYALVIFMVRYFFILLFDWRVYGAERVPRTGAVILAGNHTSVLDPPIVACCVLRRCVFLARDTLFRLKPFGALIRALGALPLPREKSAPRRALEQTLRILEKGRLMILFPEGTRSADGRLGTLKKGIGWIAKRSGAAVVPVRIFGAHEAWPRSRRWPGRRPMRVFFGEPLRYDAAETVDAFLGRLRTSIEELGRGVPSVADCRSGGGGLHPGPGSERVAPHVSKNAVSGATP